MLGLVILLALAAAGVIGCILYSRRIDRMSTEQREALEERWRKNSSGGGNGGCGGGCGGG